MKRASDPAEVRPFHGPLFETPLPHLSGRTDPPTSRQAAAAVVASGQLGNDQRHALECVRFMPGSTTKELGYHDCGLDEDDEHARQRIGRRLNELEKAGLIHRKGERDRCSLWFPGPDPDRRGD